MNSRSANESASGYILIETFVLFYHCITNRKLSDWLISYMYSSGYDLKYGSVRC